MSNPPSGDIGRFDADGFLRITGRLKEKFKLSNGKFVVPGPLEEIVKLSPFIEQAFVFGENRVLFQLLTTSVFYLLVSVCVRACAFVSER